MTDAVIAFERLTHWYGGTRAVHDLTLSVPRGTIFALLGRNGAGKTTALQCLMGFLEPSGGRALLLGHDARDLPPEVRSRVGYVAEGQNLVPWMRISQVAEFQAATFPRFDREGCAQQLRRLGLDGRKRVRELSRGQRAQLALVLALAPRPELVVLDDPTMGLDAVVRREFLEVMIDLIQQEGRALLFSAHVLTDVERVADRIPTLHDGVLRVDAPLDVVKTRIRRLHVSWAGDAPPVPEMPGVVRAVRRQSAWVVTVAGAPDEVETRARAMGAGAVDTEALGLEDLFIEYTSAPPAQGSAA